MTQLGPVKLANIELPVQPGLGAVAQFIGPEFANRAGQCLAGVRDWAIEFAADGLALHFGAFKHEVADLRVAPT